MPGEPGQLGRLMDRVEQETLAWLSAGVDGLLVENTDQPFTKVPDYFVSLLPLLVSRVVKLSNKPVGVSLLDNHPRLAATVAWATGAHWVRQPVAAGCRVCPTGLLTAQTIPPDLSLFTLSDVTLDHWLPGGAPILAHTLRSTPGDALLVTACHMATALSCQGEQPLWVLDDGTPPDIDRLPQIGGVVLRRSVLRESAHADQQTVDPNKAQRWVQGFKAATLQPI
jgi:BtpA family